MGSLAAILILATVVDRGFGYALEPSISWPDEYHFSAETIDLFSGIVKKFEIWYSDTYNRSRIDLYDGSSKRFYYGSTYKRGNFRPGKVFMYHPETVEGDIPKIICNKISYYDDQENFLPTLYGFEYKGQEELKGKLVSIWSGDHAYNGMMRTENTIYVYQDEKDNDVPIQEVYKEFDLVKGSLDKHTITNYYNYDTDVKMDSLEADAEKCITWDPYSVDLKTSLKHLHPDFPSDVNAAFHRYKKHHDKEYEDEEEHEMRKTIFARNWKRITDHNSKNLGYRLGVNKFTDQTPKELKYLAATKYEYSGPIRGTQPFPYTLKEVEDIGNELPEEHDLRVDGIISPVRDQDGCGSCWAFAAAATIEGGLAKSNGGRIFDLSEQSLVDCAWQYNSHGCEGTEAIDAVYEYLMKHGLPTVGEYGPYLGEDGLCKIQNMTQVTNIKGYVVVTAQSPNALKAALHKYGPITIGILVTGKMISYESGIFYDTECEGIGPNMMNHAVTLVGYGVRDGDLYWIIKNSWGEVWGEDGYLLIAAKNNNCNVMNVPVYPLF